MSQARLYFDEDSIQIALFRTLRARHVDVMTATEANMAGEADEKHLSWATQHGRVLYSFNIRDYARIHQTWIAQGESHGGIILARQQRFSTGEQPRRLLRLLNKRSEADMKGRLEYLSAWIA